MKCDGLSFQKKWRGNFLSLNYFRMKLFRRKLKREDLIRFDYNLAKLLENDLPLYKETLELSKVDRIGFTKKPNTITIGRIFNSELYKTIKDRFVKNFDLQGVLIWNRKTHK